MRACAIALLYLMLQIEAAGETIPDELWNRYQTLARTDENYGKWIDSYTVSTLKSYPQLAERQDEVRQTIVSVFRKEDFIGSYRSEIESDLTVEEFRQLIAYMESSAGAKIIRASARANDKFLKSNVVNVETLGKRLDELQRSPSPARDRDGALPKL